MFGNGKRYLNVKYFKNTFSLQVHMLAQYIVFSLSTNSRTELLNCYPCHLR